MAFYIILLGKVMNHPYIYIYIHVYIYIYIYILQTDPTCLASISRISIVQTHLEPVE